MFTRKLIPQVINNNGSHGPDLVGGYVEIGAALERAAALMAKHTPHGRDYQTHPTAFAGNDARKAWAERQEMLLEIRREMETAAVNLYNQLHARTK